mgnify:CR=1 FL=1
MPKAAAVAGKKQVQVVRPRPYHVVYSIDEACELLGLRKLDQVDDGETCDEELEGYVAAVWSVFSTLCKEHGVSLVEVDALTRILKPEVSWVDVCSHLRVTIHGVGLFQFDRLRDLIVSFDGKYLPKRAAVDHLHWMKDWPRVYEGSTTQSMMSKALRGR